jgi:hypothetical protein
MSTAITEPELLLGAPANATYPMLVDKRICIFAKTGQRPVALGRFVTSSGSPAPVKRKTHLHVRLDGSAAACSVTNCPYLRDRWSDQPWCVDWEDRLGTKAWRGSLEATVIAPPRLGDEVWLVELQKGQLRRWTTDDVVFSPNQPPTTKPARPALPAPPASPPAAGCTPAACSCPSDEKQALCSLWAQMRRHYGRVLTADDTTADSSEEVQAQQKALIQLEQRVLEARKRLADLRASQVDDLKNRKRLVSAADALAAVTPTKRTRVVGDDEDTE